MRISVFGLGYVGTVSCGCLAALGHEVVGIDVAQAKVDMINRGQPPIAEPGLPALVAEAVAAGRLRATSDVRTAVEQSDLAMICVGTPSSPTGGVLTTYLENVCREIGEVLRARRTRFTVFTRSTSLPEVHERLQGILAETSGHAAGGDQLGYVCHPEFLREGVAVEDFYDPPKIVFGTDDPLSRDVADRLYPGIDAAVFHVPLGVAAMVKYADNCFHAVKVTFANEIGTISREYGIDARAVMEIFCRDSKLNISPRYLKPGNAFGGSCLPKDLRALLDAARGRAADLPMLRGALRSNEAQIAKFLTRIEETPRAAVGVVGLAFKEGTDDVRESPAVAVVERLVGKGHRLHVYDRNLSLQSMIGSNRSFALQSIPHLANLLVDDLATLVEAVDVVVVNHRLEEADWGTVGWRPDQRIVDLVGVEALRAVPGYEGLYWP